MENEKITLDIVVDVQKDFITGALANQQAQANVAHLAEVAKAHAQADQYSDDNQNDFQQSHKLAAHLLLKK